ncbi:uncharacterized protein J3D65DRAFT_444128 [Phyllosticta citribraziliensis]|uniref:F-box domain-containing protein n=1 Tax=Phyllosticta citribraziliensis TaxID=989973 RepID=A0ABR1LN68_9PEZI
MPFPLSTPRSPAEEDVDHIQRQSPLLNLPSEIRLLIYSHLLPRNTDIFIHPITRKSNKGAPVPGHFWEPGIRAVGGLWLSILLVCRLTHDEAADILYGTNRFHFSMTSRERMWYSFNPQSLNKPYARGLPINTLRIFPSSALRRMRSVSIRIEEDIRRPDSYHRVQTWLAEAVSGFDDGAGAPPGDSPPSPQQQQHGLQEFTATLICGEFSYGSFVLLNTGDLYWEFRPAAPGPASVAACLYQFVLEPLAQLRGIKKVEIQGHVTPAFAQRLADTMMMGGDQSSKPKPTSHGEHDHYQEGDGGPGILCYDVQRMSPGKKRRRGDADGGEAALLVRSSRKFFEPMLDWGLASLHDPDAMEVDEYVEDEDESKREARIPQAPPRMKRL